MFLILTALLLQFSGTTEFTWAAKQVKADTVVVVSFPSDAINEQVCVFVYHYPDGDLIDRRCWTPRSAIADVEVWEGFTYKGHYVVAWLRQRHASGEVRELWATYIEGQDK